MNVIKLLAFTKLWPIATNIPLQTWNLPWSFWSFNPWSIVTILLFATRMQTYTHKHDLTWKALMIIILCLISSSWERYVGLNLKHQIDNWYNVICNCDLVTIPLFATRMQIYTHEHDLTWRVLMIMISCLIFSSWEPTYDCTWNIKWTFDIVWYVVMKSSK